MSNVQVPSGGRSSSEQARAGQAVYSPFVLALYDVAVVFLSNQFVWKCPSRRLLEHYNRNVGAIHLDVGVGTGYFLDHCRFPVPDPTIALYDLNPNSLRATAIRLRRFHPVTYQGDVLQPPPIEAGGFQSIGLNYLLHCVPGTIHTKGSIFDHLKPLLAPGGVIFGSTVLDGGVEHGTVSRWVMNVYNRTGVFSNRADDLDGLRAVLASRFTNTSVSVQGRVALFCARD